MWWLPGRTKEEKAKLNETIAPASISVEELRVRRVSCTVGNDAAVFFHSTVLFVAGVRGRGNGRCCWNPTASRVASGGAVTGRLQFFFSRSVKVFTYPVPVLLSPAPSPLCYHWMILVTYALLTSCPRLQENNKRAKITQVTVVPGVMTRTLSVALALPRNRAV